MPFKFTTENGKGVGFWGDYNVCDYPRWSVELMLQNIARDFKGQVFPSRAFYRTVYSAFFTDKMFVVSIELKLLHRDVNV